MATRPARKTFSPATSRPNQDFAWTLTGVTSVDDMNIALRTRPLAITAVALVSIAAAAAVRFVRSNRAAPRPVPAGGVAVSPAPPAEPAPGGPAGSHRLLAR